MIFSMFIKYSFCVSSFQIPCVSPILYHFLKEADVARSHLARSVPLAPVPAGSPARPRALLAWCAWAQSAAVWVSSVISPVKQAEVPLGL